MAVAASDVAYERHNLCVLTLCLNGGLTLGAQHVSTHHTVDPVGLDCSQHTLTAGCKVTAVMIRRV